MNKKRIISYVFLIFCFLVGGFMSLKYANPSKKIKWEKDVIKKIELQKIESKVINHDWINPYNSIPEIEKIVLVRFKNKITATAYINNSKEWKLYINRKNYKGG